VRPRVYPRGAPGGQREAPSVDAGGDACSRMADDCGSRQPAPASIPILGRARRVKRITDDLALLQATDLRAQALHVSFERRIIRGVRAFKLRVKAGDQSIKFLDGLGKGPQQFDGELHRAPPGLTVERAFSPHYAAARRPRPHAEACASGTIADTFVRQAKRPRNDAEAMYPRGAGRLSCRMPGAA